MSKAQFDALAAQINADLDALSPPSGGPQEFVYNLPSGYVVTINDMGIASVSFGGVNVAEGSSELFDGPWFFGLIPYSSGNWLPFNKTSQSISGISIPVVTHTYTNGLKAIFKFTIQADDVRVDATVENHGQTTVPITGIGGPRILHDNWNAKITNNLQWDSTQTQVNGTNLTYPGVNMFMSGSFLVCAAGGGKPFNVGIWPVQDLGDQYMILPNGIGLPGRLLISFFFKPIEPGQSRTFSFVYRFSQSTDWKILLQGYRYEVRSRALPLKYIPDVRPICQFASIDSSYIRADNPYGYNDNHGQSPWRRLDLGTQLFVDKVLPGMLACNYQGVILWQPQGINPRGQQYRPDFNVFPPSTIPFLPTLANGFRNAGKSVGLLARPGVIITSSTWNLDGLATQGTSKTALQELNNKFTWATNLGFNIFYLDSFVSVYDDLAILKSIREHLGPNVLTFSEFGSVADLQYGGRYGELVYENGQFSPRANEYLMWLLPEVPWIVKAPWPPGGYAEQFDYMFPNRMTPILEDYDVSNQSTINILAPYVSQYIDSENQWQ